MTTRTLYGTYAAGYALGSPITTLIVAAGGSIAGTGVVTAPGARHAYDVINYGQIAASDSPGVDGVYLAHGGSVVNEGGAVIGGYRGIKIAGAPGTVTNFGVISGESRSGLWLVAGGAVTNGAADDTIAQINGTVTAIDIGGHGALHNYGTIRPGVQFLYAATGTVTNGGAADTVADISGTRSGVYFYKGAGKVLNYGSIIGGGGPHGSGVFLGGGGRVVNGASTDASAYVGGYDGVVLASGGSINNYGVIDGNGVGPGAAGVVLTAGGQVVNGGASERTARIGGYDGVIVAAGGTVVNYALIASSGGPQPARFGQGAETAPRGEGVYLEKGGTFTNGSTGDPGALVQAYRGLVVGYGPATVTNFGTIAGSSGVAVKLAGLNDTLVAEAGCGFEGAVYGGQGVLVLASGVGTLSNFGSSSFTVSGSMAETVFDNFRLVQIAAGARFRTLHAVSIPSGLELSVAGSLTLGSASVTVVNAGNVGTSNKGVLTASGPMENNGELFVAGGVFSVRGAVTGTGVAYVMAGGTLDFMSSFEENVYFYSKAGTLGLAQSQSYAGTVNSFSTSGGNVLDLGDIGFVSATEATFSGGTTGGVLTVTDGVHTAHITLSGANYTRLTFVASSDGQGGVIVTDQAPGATTGFIAAMASLGAPGGESSGLAHPRTAALPVLAAPTP